MGNLLELLLILIAFAIILRAIQKTLTTVSDASHEMFEELRFSTQEFYTLTENLLRDKEMPAIKFSRVYHATHGALSARREYLRVQYREFYFDICAAPFAKDFFVSWRQGILKPLYRDHLERLRILKRRHKTFFELDTELMFKTSVKLCVDRAIETITAHKGVRREEEAPMSQMNFV